MKSKIDRRLRIALEASVRIVVTVDGSGGPVTEAEFKETTGKESEGMDEGFVGPETAVALTDASLPGRGGHVSSPGRGGHGSSRG